MMNRTIHKSLNCVLSGDQMLLVQCGELLLGSGHKLHAVVTRDHQIQQWCHYYGVRCVDDIDLLVADEVAVDCLFNLAENSMTGHKTFEPLTSLVPAVRQFHFYQGSFPTDLNNPSPLTVLLSGEPEFRLGCYELKGADSFDLMLQQSVSVDDNDTAFSISAKCYEAGSVLFAGLLDALGDSAFEPLHGNFCIGDAAVPAELSQAPSAAIIDWTMDTKGITKLLKALDFGPSDNPLLLPKIWLGKDNLYVKGCALLPAVSGVAPGTVLAVDAQTLTVSTVDGVLRFSDLSDTKGEAVDAAQRLRAAGYDADTTLPVLTSSQQQALDQTVETFSPYESWWQQQLLTAEPLAIPFVPAMAEASGLYQHREFNGSASFTDLSPDFVVAVLALFFSRLNCKNEFSLAYRPRSLSDCDAVAATVYSNVTPLAITVDPDIHFSQWQHTVNESITQVESRGSYPADIWSRYTCLQAVSDITSFPICLNRTSVNPGYLAAQSAGHGLIISIPDQPSSLGFSFDSSIIDGGLVDELWQRFAGFLDLVVAGQQRSVSSYDIVSPQDTANFSRWNDTQTDFDRSQLVHQLFEQQVEVTPDQLAYIFEHQQISYAELNQRANRLARHLIENGAGQQDLVGILVERSIDMIVALLAVHKAGCAYVPLDPVYPKDRLGYMVEDSGLRIVISQHQLSGLVELSHLQLILLDDIDEQTSGYDSGNVNLQIPADHLAYMIYTSGSTGNPKGVMVEHRHVVNFFEGMDQRLEPGPGTWLAVTSISFDISVLEIFWTLARGLTVVLYSDDRRQKTTTDNSPARPVVKTGKSLDFGLFYWNVADDSNLHDTDKYRLLLESAQYADQNGFNSVWTPERHFAAFGGIYPNPAITSAALATITQNVALRAGSCVVPLHSPIRIAEEWAVVDNLSNGRVGISIASGWAPPDFAIKPENFSDAKAVMFESADIVKKLWRGETVDFPGPNGDVAVRTLPRPIQKELPIWVTTAGNIDSFKQAGTQGANLLTHLLGQSLEQVAEKVQVYRRAWREAGHQGEGIISLMLHTFVGPDQNEVEGIVREPFKQYLKSAMFLVKDAAWNFPAFKAISEQQGKTLDEYFETISDEDLDAILEFAFQRYFHSSGLFGTPDHCAEMVNAVKGADIDEIACLIDFGIDTDLVQEHLPYLNQVRANSQQPVTATLDDQDDFSIPALLERHTISHFQCTPSMATLLAADAAARPGLAGLKQMMVGGEAFPPELATDLEGLVQGRVSNMYGPTEATIWSSTADIDGPVGQSVSIGKALANQQLYILDPNLQPLPQGLAGELVIGGEGVVRGYHQRPELNQERFLADPFSASPGAKMYRTGDLARFLSDGQVECLGRVDHQVKIRGYRVELGEIETLLRQHDSVLEAAVVLREDIPGDLRLVGYVRCVAGHSFDSSALKASLQEHLPEFMVPSILLELAVMPLTPNGKIDRNAMPKPQQGAGDGAVVRSEEFISPASDMEQVIADIWRDALGIDEVGIRDNFFDIGGHSLLVIQVLKALESRVNKPVKMTDLFKYATIEALAGFLGSEPGKSAEAEGISKGQARAAARKASMGRRRRSRKR